MADTATYRTIWRWHFYAGLFVLPFILLLSLSGSIFCSSHRSTGGKSVTIVACRSKAQCRPTGNLKPHRRLIRKAAFTITACRNMPAMPP